MRGDIFAWGVCKCGGKWNRIEHPVTKKALNILCASCGMPPEKFGVDARTFKNRHHPGTRITRVKGGEFIYSIHQATRLLEAMRCKWDEVGPERFDITKFSEAGRAAYKLSECSKEWQLHLEARGRSKSYTKSVEKMMRLHILPVRGEFDIREITPADIEDLQLALKKKLSHNSVVLCLSILNSLIKRYAYRKSVLDKMIVFPENWSSTESPKWRILTVAEQRHYIAKMVWNAKRRIRRNLLLLLKTYVHLGCRPGEVCALLRRNILEDGRVQIQGSIEAATGALRPTKTGKERIAPVALPPSLAKRLRSLPVLPEAYLFQYKGGSFNPRYLSKLFRSVCELPNVSFYSFSKHTLATMEAEEAVREGTRRGAKRVGVSTKIADAHYIARR